jgi:hypothetical protein
VGRRLEEEDRTRVSAAAYKLGLAIQYFISQQKGPQEEQLKSANKCKFPEERALEFCVSAIQPT